MLIYHLMYSFCVSSSVAAIIPISLSLSKLNRGNVMASIQLFLHDVLRHSRQTQAKKNHSYSAMQFVSDMQSEVSQGFPAGIYRRGVVAFLEWLTLTATLPFIVDR
jgi:hypothetical protein